MADVGGNGGGDFEAPEAVVVEEKQVVEVRERSPVPPLDVLRIYVAAEAGCDGVAVLDRMCARVREADRDRFRLADDVEKLGNADGFMNAQRRYEASREALRRYAKMLTVQYVDLKGSGCALTFGDPPVEQVRGPRGEFMMYMWATGADYDPFLNPLMSEWTQACYLCDVDRIGELLDAADGDGALLLHRRESVMMFNGVLHAMAGAQRLGVPHMRAVLPEQKPDSVEDVLKAMLYLLDRGSDVNAIDVAGNTALHHCVCVDPEDEDMSEFFRFIGLTLIGSYGADPNIRNCGGRTPLFYAVLLRNSRMADMLLRNGADFFATDNSGSSVSDAARATGAPDWPGALCRMYAEICAHEGPDADGTVDWVSSLLDKLGSLGLSEK